MISGKHIKKVVARLFGRNEKGVGNVYDHAGRLLKTYHQVNSNPEVLLSQNSYNEIGQLVERNFHSTNNGSTFKQSVDLRYNIRGWPTSINNSQLTNDGGTTNDDNNDLFGMNFSYNDVVNGIGNTPQYNGNISAIKWSNNLALGSTKDVAYKYSYDAMNRILNANYLTDNAGTWSASNAFGEGNFSYDNNGNIQNLVRTNNTGATIDNLSYTYNGNQLLTVTDAGDILNGFVDGNIGSNDYAYDANGNMIADKNKNITVIYNYLNVPQQITKGTGEKITYTYDAGGSKLKQQLYNTSGTLTKTIDYVGGFIYQNDTLQYINHNDGRVVMKTGTPEYQYDLRDHHGNTKLTFTTVRSIDQPVATFETANQATEASQFLRYDEARTINSTLFDHTHNGVTSYSERLSGSTNEKTGIARSISVMPGDTVNIEVYAKYVDASNSNNTAALTQLLAQIVAGTASAGTVIDGANYSVNGITPFPFTGLAGEGNDTGTGPKAYLNYITFDRNFVPILTDVSQTNFVRMTTVAKEDGSNVPHEHLYAQVVVKQAGYMYIYLSNEGTSPVECYFDDFKVTQIKSPVVQQQEFFPFGMTAQSYNRESSVPQSFLFNGGTELRTDLGLNTYETLFRMYDPALGRFWQIDPLADFFSGINPYSFAFDNPILYSDPDGLGPLLDLWRGIKDVVMKTLGYDKHGSWNARSSNGSNVYYTRNNGGGSGSSGSGGPPPPPSYDHPNTYGGMDFQYPGVPQAPGPSLSGGPKLTHYDPPTVAQIPPARPIKKKTNPPSPPDDPTFNNEPIPGGTRGLTFGGYQFDKMSSDEYNTPANDKLISDLVTTLKSTASVHLDIKGNFNGNIIEGGFWSRPLGYPSADDIHSIMSGRAQAIYNALIRAGVPASQLSISPGQAASGMGNQSATFTLTRP
jgi:RHS repeat-associated protein